VGGGGHLARVTRRGDIYLYDFGRPDKRRPVLVLSRDEVIPLLRTVMVAPITSSVRGAPSEVVVGVEDGLKQRSAVNLDHVQTVDQGRLAHYVGSVSAETMGRVCAALAIATGCR
jgi:mRNA interferase MazF